MDTIERDERIRAAFARVDAEAKRLYEGVLHGFPGLRPSGPRSESGVAGLLEAMQAGRGFGKTAATVGGRPSNVPLRQRGWKWPR